MGDFTLPISLDYAAVGVKTDDRPGAVGYNWNLNVGGVVTRVVRGGIADEQQGAGSAWDYLALGDVATLGVNERQVDGESDIFTAVFNGRSVNFVIRTQGTMPYVTAIPLEPTPVKIECMASESHSIGGWIITDEEGTEYMFTMVELCATTREGTVESNSLNEPSHVSSWFLTYVQPVNQRLISYEYYAYVGEYPAYGYRDSVLYQHTSTRTTVRYLYGEPMLERPYDFSKYKDSFDWEIGMAYSYFKWENADYYGSITRNGLYNSLNDFYLNASLDEIIPSKIMQNLKTMGILYDLTYVEQAYRGIITLLDRIINECNYHSPTSYTRAAIVHLNNAKQIVTTCREEVKEIYRKDAYQFSWQMVRSPLLKSIRVGSTAMDFKYSGNAGSFLLDKIVVRDMNNDSIRSIRLTRDIPARTVLTEISFHDRFGEKVSNIKFDYYGFEYEIVRTNIYGDYIGWFGELSTDPVYMNKQRFAYTSDYNTLYNSLKTINVSNDVEIELLYSPNQIRLKFNGSQSYGESGGIRIAGIGITDKLTGHVDGILYTYRNSAYVLPQIGNKLTINYPSGFSDVLYFDRLYNPGPDAYVKRGNNGVYYSSVVESFGEKGYIVYDFVLPDMSAPTYNYWNIGKPLGTCFYTPDGYLRKVIRYEYDEELALPGKKYIHQVKACDYYVSSYGPPFKYRDHPYFKDNMEKRLEPIFAWQDQCYRIAYDYSVYLKRVSEYDFEDDTRSGSWNDYLKESSCYKRTEFEYDLSQSTFPVKKTITGSDGIKYIEIVKRALDFDDGADASIPLLKASNMVGVPLKVQSKVVGYDGGERLLTERVNRYERLKYGKSMLLTETHEYVHDGTSVERVGALFGFDKARYDKTTVTYRHETAWYLPVSMDSRGDRVETRYDYLTGNPVIRVPFAPANSVEALDYRYHKRFEFRPAFKLPNALPTKYRLFVLTTLTTTGDVSLSIKQGGTTTTRSFTTRANYLGPQMFELDLTAMTGIEEISLSVLDENLVYIALVPADSEFEATSYNADGTVYCRFDHNGQAERYEYDGAGRVIKVFDENGNVLQEKSYHVVIQ